MIECMLTTIDNPFNPFEQPDQWRSFDVDHGYFTSEYLSRIAKLDIEMTTKEYYDEVERACEEILKLNPVKMYKIVRRTVEDVEPV